MKITILSICMLLASCRESTEFGKCVGFDEQKKPNLEYRISVRNAVWSFVAIETIVAPVLWATDYAFCPVGFK